MRKVVWMFVVVAALALGATAEAQVETWTHYFDCNEDLVGWSWEDECLDDDLQVDAQDGAYKHVEWMYCNGGTQSYGQWYYKDGSNWVPFSGPPGPNC